MNQHHDRALVLGIWIAKTHLESSCCAILIFIICVVDGPGTMRNPDSGMCVYGAQSGNPGMVRCNENQQANTQNRFYFVKGQNELRYETSQGAKCIDSSKSAPLSKVEMWGCHGLRGNQEWEWIAGHRIRHVIGQVCLEVDASQGSPVLVVNHCTQGLDPKQDFRFSKWVKEPF